MKSLCASLGKVKSAPEGLCFNVLHKRKLCRLILVYTCLPSFYSLGDSDDSCVSDLVELYIKFKPKGFLQEKKRTSMIDSVSLKGRARIPATKIAMSSRQL